MHLTIEFKDQKAKDTCGFVFDKIVAEKNQNLGRLKNSANLPTLSMDLTDFVFDEDDFLDEVTKTIPY